MPSSATTTTLRRIPHVTRTCFASPFPLHANLLRQHHTTTRRPRQCSPTCSKTSPDALIVGAGVAGLSAAKHLSQCGLSVAVLESSDDVGGRIRTDIVDGFLLDRGFQVFIEAYPQCRALLDYDTLDLQPFLPGAVIRFRGAFHTISDPFRAPLLALSGLFAPVGSLVDKLRVALLRTVLLSQRLPQLESQHVATPLLAYLQSLGFSPSFINAFFRPFYQGIFLAPLAEQSAAMFNFVFRMFAEAPASLPAAGIAAVPRQMAASLPPSVTIHFGATVTSVAPGCVSFTTGADAVPQTLKAPTVIVATDGPAAARLLGSSDIVPTSRGSICLYFSKNGAPPITKPILVLNGDDELGPVNNMCFPNTVARSYAPQDQTLISTTIIGDDMSKSDAQLEKAVRKQMTSWFGSDEVSTWSLLRVYRVPHSQTAQNPDFNFSRPTAVGDGMFVCGDHRNTPTLNGAIASGVEAAAAALRALKQPAL